MPVEIRVPTLGESIVDARVARWLKREGDAVAVGEALVELETDKVDVEISAEKAGVLARIAHKDGADVKIGDILGQISESPAGANGADGAVGLAGANGATSATPATPSARQLAREENVEIASVKTDGPRVTKADVARTIAPGSTKSSEQKVTAPSESPAPAAPLPHPSPLSSGSSFARTEERVRMSKRRATIARRLVEAQQTAAMLTTFNEVDMSAVMALRERQKEVFKTRFGIGLGFSSFFVKATIAALREFPRLNAEIQGDEIVLKHHYDIGVAVNAAEGLVVEDDHFAGRTALRIELDAIGAQLGREREGGQRVLRSRRRGAAVGPDERPVAPQPVRRKSHADLIPSRGPLC